MVVLSNADAVCSATTLAKVLGLTEQHARRLDKEGVLRCVRSNVRRKHYRLGESVQRYLAYQRAYVTEQVKSTDEEYTSARARRMLAMAEAAELELQVKKNELHHSDDIEHCFGMVLTSTRDKLLGVPAKVMHSLVGLTSPPAAYQVVDDAIRLALTDLSKAALANLRAESEAYLMAERNGQAADGIS